MIVFVNKTYSPLLVSAVSIARAHTPRSCGRPLAQHETSQCDQLMMTAVRMMSHNELRRFRINWMVDMTWYDISRNVISSFHITSYHIISYHIVSYHIISYHIISYHIISYHIISYHIISQQLRLCHLPQCNVSWVLLFLARPSLYVDWFSVLPVRRDEVSLVLSVSNCPSKVLPFESRQDSRSDCG